MDINPDVNKIATSILTDFFEYSWAKAKNLSSAQINKLQVAFKVGFDAYIKENIRSNSYVKTILYRDKDVHISNMYVPTTFLNHGTMVDEDGLFDWLARHRRCIIAGSAGSGKSIFMKSANLKFAAKKKVIPIFVELRHINHFNTSILHYVHENILRQYMPNIDIDSMDYALKSGKFALLLDGFDEVDYDRRDTYLKELDLMARRYPELQIILSTRPEESILSLNGFNVFHVDALSKTAAGELVNNLEFDNEVKEQFQAALQDSVYDSHREFASNPLLLTMLLLTYDQIGDMPQKMHIFFNQAFEILVFKHDRLKSLYRRKTYTSGNVEQIRDLFSYFCATSYFSSNISFTEMQLNDLLQESCEYVGQSFEIEALKLDLVNSFSLLKRDGLFVTFVHRSFQEYFTSLFLARSEGIELRSVIDELASRGTTEQCTRMLWDIAPERVLTRWFLPALQDEIENGVAYVSNPVAFITRFFQGIKVNEGALYLVKPLGKLATLQAIVDFANRFSCPVQAPNLAGQLRFSLDMQKVEDFFGGDTAFNGVAVEPRSDDNAWIAGSGLTDFIEELLAFFAAANEAVIGLERSKKGLRGFLISEPPRNGHYQPTELYRVRGQPVTRVNPKTKEETVIRPYVETARKKVE